MSGFDVCMKIRQNSKMDNVPIIFLSADIDRESILKGFELGAQDYITKPFDSRELLVRVKTHLSLKNSIERLEILNKSLEQKVLERTAQLKDANEKLEVTNLKLIDLDKAKSEFLNLISHEIRTPLNGILGPLELLKGPIYASEIGGLIGILDSSVRRLERFSLDALLITRLKTRQADIKMENISLSNLFSEVLSDQKDNIQSKNIKFEKVFDQKYDSISGEKDLVKKSINNILDNAILFSPQNGTLEVKTYLSDNFIVLEIRDHGAGFAMNTKDYLSELFKYADHYRDNSRGIGLPIVKMIQESLGGSIILGNHPDGGAVVRLNFLNKV
jgi:two-component system, sensor histidine kinase and response regulator